ncbi:MAG: NAD(+) diphosphatase [Pseudomonadota bacterium]
MKNAEQVTFGGSGLNRAAHLRGNLEAMIPKAKSIVLWRGKVLFDYGEKSVMRLGPEEPILTEAQEKPIFLGLDDDGTPLLAYDISAWDDPDADAAAMQQFFDPSQNRYPGFSNSQVFAEVRTIMGKLGPRDAELAATARGLFEWHRNHEFCARCGEPSRVTQAGWQRVCDACGASHFPRTDPVVIVLVTAGNSMLLGRSPGWPKGMYSLLAGFMEPGESIEAAARREVFEESGVRLGQVGYLSSQPWPFPSSLMIGCSAEAESTDITIDPDEIEDARWFTREEVFAASRGENPDLYPARPGSIAHFLIHNWLADTLG